MNRIAIDLSSLVFVEIKEKKALFIDGEGDEIAFYVTGNKHDRQAAVKEIMKAVEAAAGYHPGSLSDPRD